MLIRLLVLLAAIAPYTFADVQFTSPSAGGQETGGSTLSIAWKESGTGPKLSSFTTYQLFLCAGGNDAASFVPLAQVATNGRYSDGNKVSVTVSVGIGAPTKNAYFLKMMSAATGGSVINYSDRFSLSGMTGTFPPNVQAGVAGITGTDGPVAENNINNNAQAAPTAGADGGYAVTYTAQQGLTKYAPMQGKPGTKITANKPTPRYPTSSVQFAKTFLPTPSQVTTITLSVTYSASSMENQASPAPPPQNDMQKYLNRWRD